MRITALLTRADWKLNTGELKELNEFQIDVFRFRFKKPLKKDVVQDFVQFLKGLDSRDYRIISYTYIWLYQHGISFRLSFRYNPELIPKYNVRSFRQPAKLRKVMESAAHEELTSCRIEDYVDYVKGQPLDRRFLIGDSAFIG